MLKKIFIKNYKNTNDNKVRNSYGKVAGIFGIITNTILAVIKLIIGIISNSISIMVDAVNSLFDMASSILTIVGFKLSSKKPDKNHPYGYARYEYVFGFIIALLMFALGVVFAKESIDKIIFPQKLIINKFIYIILIISIIIKVLQMIVYLDFSKSIHSTTLKTTAIDTRNDIMTTSAILISLIIMQIFDINIDGILGLIVSLFVIYSSYKMIRELLEPIIGIKPDKEKVDKIKNKILSYDYVLGIHDLVIHNYGVNNEFVTVHVEVDSSLSMIEAHDLLDEIENYFKEKNIYITIHLDPVIVGDKKVDKIKNEITNTLKQFDEELSIHDFRMIEGNMQTKILFDCVIPYEKEYNEKDLVKYLKSNIKEENTKYLYLIEIDRPFC